MGTNEPSMIDATANYYNQVAAIQNMHMQYAQMRYQAFMSMGSSL
jgi:hypothetical protein